MKKVVKKERFSIYLDSKLLNAIKKESEKNSRTANSQIIFCLTHFLHAKPESGA